MTAATTRQGWTDDMERLWARIEQVRSENAAELISVERRIEVAVSSAIERSVDASVTSALMKLMTSDGFREHSCPHIPTLANIATIQTDVAGLRTNLERLDKKLFNGEGVVTKIDGRLREVESGMKMLLPFMPGPRSRGLLRREDSGESEPARDPDKLPSSFRGIMMRVPWFVWVLIFVNVFTVLLLFAALAREPQMDNLQRMIDAAVKRQSAVSAPGSEGKE